MPNGPPRSRLVWLTLVLWMAVPAVAQDQPDEAAVAEYRRLAGEMRNLANRGAWSGVERAYVQALLTGHQLAFDDYLRAAHAARVRGDVGAARTRLLGAKGVQASRDVIDWLWSIDSSHGRVMIDAWPGAVLTPTVASFLPDHKQAGEFAQTELRTEGKFEGLLPLGDYVLAGHEMSVTVHRVITLRIEPPPSHKPRRKKAR